LTSKNSHGIVTDKYLKNEGGFMLIVADNLEVVFNRLQRMRAPGLFPGKSYPYLLFTNIDIQGEITSIGKYLENIYLKTYAKMPISKVQGLPAICHNVNNYILSFGDKASYCPDVVRKTISDQHGTLIFSLADTLCSRDELVDLKKIIEKTLFDLSS
jgi:hypothetical protein